MNHIEQYNEAAQRAMYAAYSIEDTARALARVGSPLADELYSAIEELHESRKAMNDAVGANLMEQVKTADRHIAEIFLAALHTADERRGDVA